MTERIRVVSAAIVYRFGPARILLGQRGPGMDCALTWCTPGGKVEPGETDEHALRRELAEELDVFLPFIEPAHFATIEVDPPRVRRPIELHMYTIEVEWTLTLTLSAELTGVGWFTASDLAHLDLCPADHDARAVLVALLNGPA